MLFIRNLLFFLIVFFFISSCKKEEDVYPVIITGDIYSLENNGVEFNAFVTYLGKTEIVDRGL